MKRLGVLLLSVIVLALGGSLACAEKLSMSNAIPVLWRDIVSALNETGSFSRYGVIATLEDNKAIVSGGTIQDVEITNGWSKKIETVEIDNTVLIGERIALEALDGREFLFKLGGNTIDRTEMGIKVEASCDGKMTLNNYADVERIETIVAARGEMSVTNYGTIADSIGGICRGKLDVVNYGEVLRAINVCPSEQGVLCVTNAGEAKSFQTYSDGKSIANVNNSGNISGIFCIGTENSSTINAVNTGTIAGLVVEAMENGKTVFNNNGVVTNEDGLNIDKNVYVMVDETGRVVIDGTGIVQPGAILIDYLTDKRIEETPAESIQIQIGLNGARSSVNNAREKATHILRKNIGINLSGINAHVGKDQILAIVFYDDLNGMPQRCLIRQRELLEETGIVTVGGEDTINNFSPVKVPTLVLPDDAVFSAPVFLKYKELETGRGKITYDLRLIDQNGNEVNVPKGSIVVFPYPEDITIKNAMEYLFTIVHRSVEKTEFFSTLEETIELKEAGLCIHISSFSPFEITWENQPKIDLPKTGDNSNLGLWLAMLALAGVALMALRSKTV